MAFSNKSRTREAPTPTNISTKSEPEMEKKGTPASPATALASKVLPVPGGPTSSTPLGIRAPRELNLPGFFKNSTISRSSSFSSSAPATSAKVVLRFSSLICLILALPKFICLSPPPPAPPRWRIMKIQKKISPPNRISVGSRLISQLVSAGLVTSWTIFLSGWASL